MTGKTLRCIVLMAIVNGTVGCGGSTPAAAPTAPSPVAQLPVVPPGPSFYPGYTLTAASISGVVFESTAEGPAPLEGVRVYCDACGERGHTGVYTDKDGLYRFSGDIAQGGGVFLSNGATTLIITKAGYDVVGSAGRLSDGSGMRIVPINGDTRFDIELVRR